MHDGSKRELQHNIITQNLYSQCDSEGRQYQLLDEICDICSNNKAVKKSDPDTITYSKNRNQHLKRTKKGWNILATWKDQSQDWVPLKEMYASHPLETAEFVVSRGLQDEPAFAWWVSNVLNTRKLIIEKVKSLDWKQSHKFGIKLPKSVQEAHAIDKANGNNLWTRVIEKEMGTVCKNSFKRYWDSNGNEPNAAEVQANPKKHIFGYKEITCHLVFDIKLDSKFTPKARFVANGSKTN